MTLKGGLRGIGRAALSLLASIGRVALFAGAVLGHLFRPPFYPREFFAQLMQIGWFSLPRSALTAPFTGGGGGRAV